MRTLISVLLLIVILSSSCTKSFYQVYRTSPLNDVKISDDMLVYEDENCIITYHLWSEYGKLQFLFTNKTQSNIYLNVGESFFIKNGMAYDYFKNRAYTNTTLVQKEAADDSNTADKKIDLFLPAPVKLSQESPGSKEEEVPQYSISSFEEKVVCIPYKTSKIFSEFMINEILYRDCNLLRFPATKKQILTATFSKEDSPINSVIDCSILLVDQVLQFRLRTLFIFQR
jgi:hypothetical protein